MKLTINIVLGLLVTAGLVIFLQTGSRIASAQSFGPHFTAWSTPQPAQGQDLNTTGNELPNSISRDGLSMYFHRINAGTLEDLYVVRRPDTESPWGLPVRLPDGINSIYNDRTAFPSADGHWLFFASNRPNGFGGFDLYVSWRKHVHDDGGWELPVNLSTINSPGFDAGPALFEDESGIMQLYFTSTPTVGGPPTMADIYMSVLGPGGFEPPSKVIELSGPASDARPYLRKDGREIYFQSNRSGTLSVWTSTRNSTAEPWAAPTLALSPEDLGDATVILVTTPVLSWDAKTLFVGVGRASGNFDDIYVADRERVGGR